MSVCFLCMTNSTSLPIQLMERTWSILDFKSKSLVVLIGLESEKPALYQQDFTITLISHFCSGFILPHPHEVLRWVHCHANMSVVSTKFANQWLDFRVPIPYFEVIILACILPTKVKEFDSYLNGKTFLLMDDVVAHRFIGIKIGKIRRSNNATRSHIVASTDGATGYIIVIVSITTVPC